MPQSPPSQPPASPPSGPSADPLDVDGVDLSLIIPAYNEAHRLPATLARAREFLRTQPYSWEIIVADDGSEDETPRIAAQAAVLGNVRHLRLPHRGKAAAVRAGVAAARGHVIVFTDADLSTPIAYAADAYQLLTSDYDVVIGSREVSGARRFDEPSYRHLMGRVFNYAVQLLAIRGIRDTQCGFKAFRADVARDLFNRSLLYRSPAPVRGPRVTGFDVELLFLARRRGYRLRELPVAWHHVEGSKVRPGADSLRMFGDLLQVRLNQLRGRYDQAADLPRRADARSS